MTTVQILQGKP